MSATRPRKEQYGGVLAAVKANPTGGLRPALTPAPGTTPPTAIRGQQETRSLQLKSPRNQGNPGLPVPWSPRVEILSTPF